MDQLVFPLIIMTLKTARQMDRTPKVFYLFYLLYLHWRLGHLPGGLCQVRWDLHVEILRLWKSPSSLAPGIQRANWQCNGGLGLLLVTGTCVYNTILSVT